MFRKYLITLLLGASLTFAFAQGFLSGPNFTKSPDAPAAGGGGGPPVIDATNMVYAGSVSVVTNSHTCTGSNRLLVVDVASEDSASGITVSGITYAGVALTRAHSNLNSLDRDETWYLINPASGANNIITTMAASSGDLFIFSTSYTNAKQSGQPDATNAVFVASTTAFTNSITSVAANCIVHDVVLKNTGAGLISSAGAGQVYRLQNDISGSCDSGVSDKTATTAGSYNMSWTYNNASATEHILTTWAPAP